MNPIQKKKQERRAHLVKLTICAVMASLSIVIMYVGALLEVLDLCTLFVASLFVAFCVAEFGIGWGWMTFGVSAILALVLIPNNFTALEYAAIVGVLPLLKFYIEKVKRPFLQWVLKELSFNALYILVLFIFVKVLGMPFEDLTIGSFTVSSSVMPIIFLFMGNLCFVLYDTLLTRLLRIYYYYFHEKIERKLNSIL